MPEAVVVETEEVEETDVLACVQGVEAIDVFRTPGGTEKILDAIREAVGNEVADLTTAAGRDAVRSNAHKVSKAKMHLDRAAMALVADAKKLIKEVDPARKLLRDGCDAIRDEVRLPLTAWEEEEAERQRQNALDTEIAGLWDSAHMENELFDLKLIQAEQEAAEERRVERERLAEEQREREDKARKEAKAQAKADAAAAIEAEKEKVRVAEQAQEKAEQEATQATIDAKAIEVAAKKEAEEQAKIAQGQAEFRQKQAAEKAEKETAKAVQAERDRIEQEAAEAVQIEAIKKEKLELAEEAERQERLRDEADKEHREDCQREARDTLVEGGLSPQHAENVVGMIAQGKVPHVEFNYAKKDGLV